MKEFILALTVVFLTISIAGGFDEHLTEIQASKVLERIKAGLPVELDHVIIKGNLNLTGLDLPTRPVSRGFRNAFMIPGLSKNVTCVSSPIRICHSVIEGDIDLNNTLFDKLVDFEFSEFNSDVNFLGSRFNSDVNFESTNFYSIANFRSTYFNRTAEFRSAHFYSFANFDHANFNEYTYFILSEFNGYADFNSTNFCRESDFWSSTFNGSAYFTSSWLFYHNSSRFNGPADFGSSKFIGPAYFAFSEFDSTADFAFSKFNGPAYFENSSFLGNVGFKYSNFSNIAYFESSEFNEPADFGFSKFKDNSDFMDSKFKNCTYFNNSKFDKSINFRRSHFGNLLCLNDIDFDQIYLDWGDINGTKRIFDGKVYLSLIDNYRKRGFFEDADNCYLEYMTEHRNQPWGVPGEPLMKFLDLLSELSYGYGVRPMNPLLISGFIIILFTFFWRHQGIGQIKEKSNRSDSKWTTPIEDIEAIFNTPIEHIETILNALEPFFFSFTLFLAGTKLLFDSPELPAHMSEPRSWTRRMFYLEKFLGSIFFALFLIALSRTIIRSV